ncbi:MAG: hypothetical protein HC782_03880, partial [Gammaproteobacteria bacterium]|nr:hypothetical protein [Gammaproteobacteria bacterium]
SVTRNTLRAVDFLPSFYGFGLIASLLNRDFKRLGDLAAGTVVVYVANRNKPLSTLQTPSATTTNQSQDEWHSALTPALLTLSEQRAIINFAERSARFSAARAAELAAHTPQLLNGKVSVEAIAHLHNLARQITGKRVHVVSENANQIKVAR